MRHFGVFFMCLIEHLHSSIIIFGKLGSFLVNGRLFADFFIELLLAFLVGDGPMCFCNSCCHCRLCCLLDDPPQFHTLFNCNQLSHLVCQLTQYLCEAWCQLHCCEYFCVGLSLSCSQTGI